MKFLWIVVTAIGLWTEQSLAHKSSDVFEFSGFYYEPPTLKPPTDVPSTRIVGGTAATEGQFPYQVSLRKYGQHICGGSIVSANYILTAAHCVTDLVDSQLLVTPAHLLTIRAGSNNLTSDGVVVQVTQVKPNPNYRYESFDNDVALLKLTQSLTFSSKIAPIALIDASVPADVDVVVSGWGRVGATRPLASTLQFVRLRSIGILECSEYYDFDEAFLCLAHPANEGICFGDSGGPAVYQNHLVGIANFVIRTCATDFPDGYARVSKYLEWIRDESEETVQIK